MRRLHRTHVRSFSHGLMLAALPVIAFLGVDYLIAPPGGYGGGDAARSAVGSNLNATANSSASATASSEVGGRPSRLDDVATSRTATSPVVTGALPTARPMTLATSIQSELRRVGCYSGDVDGVWNERTRVAMRAFNTSVHVNLGIDKPDYILLTLLQGHSSKACSRSCDTAAANGGACIDKSIEARALPPATLATRTVAERSRGEARTSSVTVSAPIVLSKTPVPARTADSLGVAPVPAGRWVSETKVAVPVAPSTGSADSRATEAVAEKPPPVIPGRMAVGALPTPEARPGSGSATDISDARPVQRERSRPAPVATARSRPERSTPTRRSRLSRTFSELNHNSP